MSPNDARSGPRLPATAWRAAPGAALALAITLPGCGYRPPRFADAPPVLDAGDDAPSDEPRSQPFVEAVYLTDIYVRAALLNALDPKRIPTGGDVNAFDEVPRSQWFDATPGRPPETEDGPPVPPLTVVPNGTDEGAALAIVDARARSYELRFDAADRPGMRTGAAASAIRLAASVGYIVPETYLVDIRRADLTAQNAEAAKSMENVLGPAAQGASGAYRASATRWPAGIDLGSTPPSDRRHDDPNDRVAHRDRRTLRAIRALGTWLGISRLDAHVLRDAYVGLPGQGHVRHYIVGLEGAFGADAVVREGDVPPEGEEGHRNVFVRLGTFGFSPSPRLVPTQREHPSLGAFPLQTTLAAFDTSPPFEPANRALPDDLYWAAKRIARVPVADIRAAVDAGDFRDSFTRIRILEALAQRRAEILKEAFAGVTPCEVEGVEGRTLVVRDEEIGLALADAEKCRYDATFIDSDGVSRAPAIVVAGDGARVAIPLPPPPETREGYLVVRLRSRRGAWIAPRTADVHLVSTEASWRVVGVRH